MVQPASLPLRKVGKNGPMATAIGFGAMGLGISGYGSKKPDEERLKLLDRAWELGCTNWDTAAPYGDSEELIGKWFKLHPERRGDIFLATKFGLELTPDRGFVVDSSPEACRKVCEQSLKLLGVDSIDLYYMHRANPDTPIEATVAEMKKLKEEGKIKYIGLSEVSSATLRRAQAIHPISAVQVEYNPWTTDIEDASGTNLLDTCKELDVAVFAYSPLGRGILTGRFRSIDDFEPDDVRRSYERFQPENMAKNLVLVDKFHEVAKRKGCSPGQLVLAWLSAQDEHIFVIPGTSHEKYLEDNIGAATLALSKQEDQELRKLVEDAGVHGGRDPNFGSYMDTVPLAQ